jgi:hypothetical protein
MTDLDKQLDAWYEDAAGECEQAIEDLDKKLATVGQRVRRVTSARRDHGLGIDLEFEDIPSADATLNAR